MPTENAGTKSRSGGMSVSLASPDGRVVGGGLAGLLVAAGPVQVYHHFLSKRQLRTDESDIILEHEVFNHFNSNAETNAHKVSFLLKEDHTLLCVCVRGVL